MYKVNSDLSQRRARQLWLRDLLPANFDDLPPEQQRENLVAQWKLMQQELKTVVPLHRKKIGQRLHVLQQEISAIRPALKGGPDVRQYFIDVARERLTAFQFRSFMDEANKRLRDDEAGDAA